MSDPTVGELLELNQRLLNSIAEGDWATYQDLSDPSLTSLEPESLGQVVEGMTFHRYYFDLGGIRGRHQTTVCAPHVRVMGDVGVLAYMRLVQRIGPDGNPVTMGFAETRVWQRRDGRWRHVHFHRSMLVPMSS
jgi:calcium/calmodulin-dependent protein kinase (CaM kinase) II